MLPAKELCALARSKGILSAVDGAHVPGMMRLNIHDLGCDMYSSSPHKWLQAPKGSGFLYVRDEVIDRLWNTIVTEGWDDTKIRAERFQRIGSSNVPALWGLRASIKLANDIGLDRIERRHRKLADYILDEMKKRGCRILDLARPRFALRHRDGERPTGPSHGSGKLACGRPIRSASEEPSRTSCGSRRLTICRRKTLTGFWRSLTSIGR